MRNGLPMGRIGAVPVILRPTWFAVAALTTVLYAPAVRLASPSRPGLEYVVSFGFAVLLLLSVFVHELAHAQVAAATGTPATRIVLDVWGGHTAFSQPSRGPWRAVAVAVAGPLSNAGLALAAELGVRAVRLDSVSGQLLVATATANLVVAGFNALPGLPLDGGRVLEALVWRVTGDRMRATVVAGWSGRVVATGIALWALLRVMADTRGLSASIWLVLIAGLLWRGAGQSIAAAHWEQRAERAQIDELLQPAVAVESTATVETARRRAGEAGASAVVVLDVYGRPAAIVDERAAAGVPLDRVGQVGAAAVAHPLPDGAVLSAGLGGDALLSALREFRAERYAVLDTHQRVIGVLDLDDVARFVSP